ncbi:hypothetical protein N2152v2_001335 [Parachlorella kessleri]
MRQVWATVVESPIFGDGGMAGDDNNTLLQPVFEGGISSSGSGAAAGGGLVQGLLQGVGRLLDWASGQAQDRDAVLRHQAQQAQQAYGSERGIGRGREGFGVLQGT